MNNNEYDNDFYNPYEDIDFIIKLRKEENMKN